MKFLTLRVVARAMMSILAIGALSVALFTVTPSFATPTELDKKTVASKAYVDTLASHRVNGQPLSNSQITLYGTSDTDAASRAKTVKLYDYSDQENPVLVQMSSLVKGMVIVIKPDHTHNSNISRPMSIIIRTRDSTLPKPVQYNGLILQADAPIASKIWNENNPSVFVYDGTYWQFVSGGLNGGVETMVWRADETTSSNAYDTTFVGDTGATESAWPTADKTKLVDGPALANALSLKQNILTARAQNAPVTIPTYPAYGQSDGVLGQMLLDTTTLDTSDDSHFPSSKLLNTTLSLYVPKSGAYNVTNLNSDLSTSYTGAPSWATSNGVASLYLVPGAVSGSNWAANAMNSWATQKIVPTMDTLAKSLAGLYSAVGGSIGAHIEDYEQTGTRVDGANIPIPDQIEYTGEQHLTDGNQLFWVSKMADAGNEQAVALLKYYSDNNIAPNMDELARALDGLSQTRETTLEWQRVADRNSVTAEFLYRVGELIKGGNVDAVAFNDTGYLQTFAPTLEALMNESAALKGLIDAKQNKLNGTNGTLVTYGATAGSTGSKAIASTITNNANTVPNTAAVYNAVDARQVKIPGGDYYLDTSGTKTAISNWTTDAVKGSTVLTSATTDGSVGKRNIFEAGDTYTNDAATNIQIATIGAVMENTVTKTCAEWRPGTTVAQRSAATCWLWEITGNAGNAGDAGNVTACENPGGCRFTNDCCDGFVCESGRCTESTSTNRP